MLSLSPALPYLLLAWGNHALEPRATPMTNKVQCRWQTVWTGNVPTAVLWVSRR